MRGIGAYYELEVHCAGEPDPQTGYLLNISAIDEAVRQHAIPIIEHAARHHPHRDPATVLAPITHALQAPLANSVRGVRWRLSPYYSAAMATPASDRVLISQQFEFSASHRLHVRELSDQRNREIFGKCNNPNSHGHNYRIEVTIVRALDEPHTLSIAELERIVNSTVIQRFDHKHLNLDTSEFATLNPSVENIAWVCFKLLQQPIAAAGGGLKSITVWETEKTSCTYPAA